MSLADNLSKESLEQAGITWKELQAIKADFEKKRSDYEQLSLAITNVMLKTPGVHSVRYRVKDSVHLMEKVVRKRLANPERKITIENYEQELTDLGGIRVLHLFKGDWRRIHRFITSTWRLHEQPTAYYREGDSPEILAMFTERECEVRQHPAGYRSVHYIVESSLTKEQRLVEIQVRTIFEEGWSEVDHKLRYPSFSNNPLTNNLLSLLNRLAGSADEMSSFVQELQTHLRLSEHKLEAAQAEHKQQVEQMQKVIDELNLSAQDKSKLEDAAKSLGADKVNQTGLNINSTLWFDAKSNTVLSDKRIIDLLAQWDKLGHSSTEKSDDD